MLCFQRKLIGMPLAWQCLTYFASLCLSIISAFDLIFELEKTRTKKAISLRCGSSGSSLERSFAMERCISCQGELDPATRRCRQCGQFQPITRVDTPAPAVETQSIRCPQCGNIVRAGARFCSNCGYNLGISVTQRAGKDLEPAPITPVPPQQRYADFVRAPEPPGTPELPLQGYRGRFITQNLPPKDERGRAWVNG